MSLQDFCGTALDEESLSRIDDLTEVNDFTPVHRVTYVRGSKWNRFEVDFSDLSVEFGAKANKIGYAIVTSDTDVTLNTDGDDLYLSAEDLVAKRGCHL